MNEYRCTRPDLYPVGSLGHTNPSARQGHYVFAESAAGARAKMAAQFPGERIDVTFWRRVEVARKSS